MSDMCYTLKNPEVKKWFNPDPSNPVKVRCICCDVAISITGKNAWTHVNISDTHRLNQKVYELQSQNYDITTDNERLKDENKELKEQLEKIDRQCEDLLEENETLRSGGGNYKLIGQKEKEIESLNEQNEHLKDKTESQKQLIDNLNEQKLKAQRDLVTIRNQQTLDLKAYIDENEKLKKQIEIIKGAFT